MECPTGIAPAEQRDLGGHQQPDPGRKAQGPRLPEQAQDDHHHLPDRRPAPPTHYPHDLARSHNLPIPGVATGRSAAGRPIRPDTPRNGSVEMLSALESSVCHDLLTLAVLAIPGLWDQRLIRSSNRAGVFTDATRDTASGAGYLPCRSQSRCMVPVPALRLSAGAL